MFEKITPLQWEYLGKPEGICILFFENEKAFHNALFWINIGNIPWEMLLMNINDNVVPNTVVIPANMLEKFQNPNQGMVGTFELTKIAI